MINLTKTFAAAAITIAFAGSAVAQDTVSTAISYDPALSPQVNYDGIRETAKAACDELHARQTTSFSNANRRAKKKCRAQIVKAAVDTINDPFITAIHENGEVRTPMFASKN